MNSFPNTLLHVIESQQYPDAIGWGGDGTVWVNRKSFHQTVMQVHFKGIKKFPSFARKMNRYGFKRIMDKSCSSSGVFVYRHHVFRPGVKPEVAKTIRIQRNEVKLTSCSPHISYRDDDDDTIRHSTLRENLAVAHNHWHHRSFPMCGEAILYSGCLRTNNRMYVNAALALLNQGGCQIHPHHRYRPSSGNVQDSQIAQITELLQANPLIGSLTMMPRFR